SNPDQKPPLKKLPLRPLNPTESLPSPPEISNVEHESVSCLNLDALFVCLDEIKATDVDITSGEGIHIDGMHEEKRRNSRICDMLFIATSHRLADFIFSLGNHCLQLSDRERIDVKLKITSDL
ncbi:LOW QUALITY PROTEIN: hypothetical protein HID58_022803, partial [Brassica napus]